MIFKRTFNLPIYTGRIGIIFTDDMNKVAAEFDFSTRNAMEYDGITFSKGTQYFVAFDINDFTPGIAAHEAKHLVNIVFRDSGVFLDPDNDEAECYFLGWVVDKIYEVFDKYD